MAAAKTGTERQRAYRARRESASIDVSMETIEMIRGLRDRTGKTVDEVVRLSMLAAAREPRYIAALQDVQSITGQTQGRAYTALGWIDGIVRKGLGNG